MDPDGAGARRTDMPRRARVDWAAVAAAAPFDVIHLRDLAALGVPSSTVSSRCAPGGVWVRVLSAVIALTRGVLTGRQRIAAALLYAGPEAVITGVAACRLYGLLRVPDDETVHALVPHATRRRSQSFVITERTIRLPRPLRRDDVPVAPIFRAVLDAARRLRRLDEIRALLTEAVQRRLTTVAALRQELEEGSQRGTALVRRVVVELEDGVRSAAEAWGRGIVGSMPDFPPVIWNASLEHADGSFLACVDGFVDGVALAIEVHSFAHHADRDAFDATMRRQARLVAAGIVVVPVTPRQLRDEPEVVKRLLWDALEQARARPRPPVRVRG